MLNNLLLSFFFGMPAIVAIFLSRDLRNPLARSIMLFGGIAATICVVMVLAPLLFCNGMLQQFYSGCTGGGGVAALFTKAAPAIRLAGFIYIMVGPPLAILVYLIEWLGRRRTA